MRLLAVALIFTFSLVYGEGNSWDIPLGQIAQEQLDSFSPEELDRDWKLTAFFGTVTAINMLQAKRDSPVSRRS